MKSFITLLPLAALATADSWGYTWTGGETSTFASAPPVQTVAPSDYTWTFTTSYTATYSSANSTWGIPTVISYSACNSWTSMIPATTSAVPTTVPVYPASSTFVYPAPSSMMTWGSSMASSASASAASWSSAAKSAPATTLAPTSVVASPSASSTAPVSTFTGAAAHNVVGLGAAAVAAVAVLL